MKIITTQEAATMLHTSARRVRQLVTELGLSPSKVGNALILTRADVAAMGRRNKQRGPKGGKKK